jgi:hypothetical protein
VWRRRACRPSGCSVAGRVSFHHEELSGRLLQGNTPTTR